MEQDKAIEEESKRIAEEIIADLKREDFVFKQSDKDPSYYEEISKKDIESYKKLLDTGIAEMLLKM